MRSDNRVNHILPHTALAGIRDKQRNGQAHILQQTKSRQGGRPFKLYKFRSMTDARDENGNLLPDAERITPIGQKIRSSSIDELPQLLTSCWGDMSIVGPRPLLLDYVPLYNEEQRKRLEVKQGITGWAQIHGRNATTWEERFKNDVWYVDNWSFWLDIKIILTTVQKVTETRGNKRRGRGYYAEIYREQKQCSSGITTIPHRGGRTRQSNPCSAGRAGKKMLGHIRRQ